MAARRGRSGFIRQAVGKPALTGRCAADRACFFRLFLHGDTMTEHNSLYLRIRLSRHAYESYLASASADARDFSDWMDWLGKAGVGGFFTAEKIAEIGQKARKVSTADTIQALDGGIPGFVRSQYDEATETWRLGIPFFSEEYVEYLERLPPLRAVGRFKDRPG
jgi:hypothetical protein